nr:hypothetical protein GCM10020093_084870 [Planobispora longispora]
MLAVQVVGAVGEDHQDRRGAQVAAEEGDQVAAGAVGPVDVLDDQQDGTVLGQALQEVEDLLEEPRAGGLALRGVAGLAELGQQPGQVAGPAVGQERRHLLGALLADELADHRGERRVGQALGGELHAAADQHVRAVALGAFGEARDQPGFADPCFAPEKHGRRGLLARLLEGLGQARELRLPPHEDGAHRPTHHVVQHGMPYVVLASLYPVAE